jgi:hypothetical protein
MRASTLNYSQPSKKNDRVVLLYDGYSSYLLVIDEASCYIWVFLTTSKEPPLDIIDAFLGHFRHKQGREIHTEHGGELARSFALSDTVLRTHQYVMEPTGADSPSQNGAVKIYSDKLAIRTRTLLYGAGLPAKFWLAALLHLVYLHNRLVQTVVKKTPYKGYFGFKPDIGHLKLFGSRVCVKCSGNCRSKLDKHDFKGIFLGYTATDHNIVYLDLDSGLVKWTYHAQFDEAWYLQETRPPASQLLYDLGVEPDKSLYSETGIVALPADSDFCLPGTIEKVHIPWPPMATSSPLKKLWRVPDRCTILPLPLRHMAIERDTRITITAKAAQAQSSPGQPHQPQRPWAVDIMTEYNIGRNNMAMVYMSPDPYFDTFEQPLDIRHFDLAKHATVGLSLYEKSGRLYLVSMSPSTPAAKIPDWCTQVWAHGSSRSDLQLLRQLRRHTQHLRQYEIWVQRQQCSCLHTRRFNLTYCRMAYQLYLPRHSHRICTTS